MQAPLDAPLLAYGQLPEEVATLELPGRPEHIFSRLQRPWTYRDGKPWLSRDVLQAAAGILELQLPQILERQDSQDGSLRLLFGLRDGARIEAVFMPRPGYPERATLCLSSQVGCELGCAFCATGRMGLKRNLLAGEIVGQVLAVLHLHPTARLHLAFMGMGEPLQNLTEVHRAIRVLCHPAGLNISPKRITVSTAGWIPGLEALAPMEPRPWLALSLHAGTDELRSRLMPLNRRYPLAALKRALESWNPKPNEKLVFEILLLQGVNDGLADADALAAWLGAFGKGHNLNLIHFNAHEGCGFQASSEAQAQIFADRLKALGYYVTRRLSRGRDVKGACGQLAGKCTSAVPNP